MRADDFQSGTIRPASGISQSPGSLEQEDERPRLAAALATPGLAAGGPAARGAGAGGRAVARALGGVTAAAVERAVLAPDAAARAAQAQAAGDRPATAGRRYAASLGGSRSRLAAALALRLVAGASAPAGRAPAARAARWEGTALVGLVR